MLFVFPFFFSRFHIMNFKDFQFSIGKLKADVHSQIARNNPLHKQDTKALSLWIYQERTDLASMRTITYERSETIKALKAWIKEQVEEESNNAEDLQVSLLSQK